jgi:hypothetical protein
VSEKLSWTDFRNEVQVAWVAHLRHEATTDEFDFVRANAHRVGTVPSARIIREAPRGWNGQELLTLLHLESLGVVTLEHDDAYVAALATGSTERLRQELDGPEFIPLVWRMLELGADGLRYSNWDVAIRGWVADGTLDRPRLLRTLLDGLTRGYGNAIAKWYADLYLAFEPTAAETAADGDRVRAMFRAPERGTIKLATTLAQRMHAGGVLEAESFLAAVPDVATLTGANAKIIVRLAVELAGADAALEQSATTVLSSALAHPQRDIQSAALAWLEKHGAHEVVASSAPLLSPAVAGARVAVAVDDAAPRAERTWRAFEPWPDDEVLERTAVLLEDASDPLEIEAGLAALAALYNRSSLAPLADRALVSVERGDVRGLFGTLVLAASGVAANVHTFDVFTDSEFPVLTLSRFEEVRMRLLKGRAPHDLLATPQSAAGWVGAMSLVDRMAAARDAPWPSDLTAALLRLDRDDPQRDEAAAIAAGHSRFSEAWSVVAYALGGKPGRVKTSALWVAAARARSDEPDAHLARAGLRRSGQSTLPSVRLEAVVTMRKAQWPVGSTKEYADLRVNLISPAEGSAPKDTRNGWARKLDWYFDQPTVIPTRTQVPDYYTGRPDIARWVGLTWPRSVEFAASVGVMQLAGSSALDMENPTLGSTLTAIAESPGSIGEIGRACVAFGLSGKHRLDRAQAAELLAAELGARLNAVELATTMATLVEACKLNRWAESFADAALISTRSRLGVIALLSTLLPSLSASRTGMSALLEVLDDELRRAGLSAADPALREWLGGFSGSSKAAKAAKAILALTPVEAS